MTDHEPAMIVDRQHTPPSKKVVRRLANGDVEVDENDNQGPTRWDGVDLFVIVGRFDRALGETRVAWAPV